MTDPGVAEKEFWAVGGLLEAYPEHPESSSTAGLLDADPHSKRGRGAASVYMRTFAPILINMVCKVCNNQWLISLGSTKLRRMLARL